MRCHGAFGHPGGQRFVPGWPAPSVLCGVCAAAAEMTDVLTRLDRGERLLVLDVLPLSFPMMALRHGEGSDYREVQLDALALVAAGRWKLSPTGPRLSQVEKVALLRPGLVLALGEIEDVPRYRLRRQWHEGAPAAALYRDAIRWVLGRAIRHARRDWREQAGDRPARFVGWDALATLAAPTPVDPPEAATRLAALLAVATPRQRQLLDALLELAQAPEGVNVAEGARRVGMNPKTAHEHLARLRAKAG